MLKQTYLYRLYHYNKKLFYGITLFAGLTIFCNVVGWQITPFFVWSMFSAREQPAETYDVLQIKINKQVFDYTKGQRDINRFFINYPLNYAISLYNRNYVDPPNFHVLKKYLPGVYNSVATRYPEFIYQQVNLKSFMSWYADYLSRVLKIKITSVEVDQVAVHYLKSGQLQPVKTDTLVHLSIR